MWINKNENRLMRFGIFFQKIGKTGGKKLIINDHEEAAIETLKKIHENWFNNYLEE